MEGERKKKRGRGGVGWRMWEEGRKVGEGWSRVGQGEVEEGRRLERVGGEETMGGKEQTERDGQG